MTDIARKLELIAHLQTGEMWPDELGPELGESNNWGTALSAICAEALAEIKRLRHAEWQSSHQKGLPSIQTAAANSVYTHAEPIYKLPPDPVPKYCTVHFFPCKCVASAEAGSFKAEQWPVAGQLSPQDVHEPAPDPWGSAFAMNTENWA